MNTLLLAFPVVNLGDDYVEKPGFTKLKDVCYNYLLRPVLVTKL